MGDSNNTDELSPKMANDGEIEHVEKESTIPSADKINQRNAKIYLEALQRYPNDECIDKEEERRLKRKIDRRILPLLGICYFFYVSLNNSTLYQWQGG